MILVLGGTKDGRDISRNILDMGYKVIVTVTTEYGQELLGKEDRMKVYCYKLEESSFKDIVNKEKIKIIVDATHPYATEISKLAMSISNQMDIPYMRFERKGIHHGDVIEVNDFEEAVEYLKYTKGNIMLTTGSKNLDIFAKNLEKERLYARVLPTSNVIERCEGLGINAGHIIGIQGPFDKELNKSLFNQYNIDYMVTKESGNTGGTSEKIQGAIELGIKVVLVKRPKIVYRNTFCDLDKLIKKIKEEVN